MSGTADWALWSTTARLVVLDPARLAEAKALVLTELDAVERAASRFRADSEINRVNAHPGRHTLSPVLADLVRVALAAADATDGAVDPTLGHALVAAGYDADIDTVRGRVGTATATGGVRVVPRIDLRRKASWRDVHLDGTTLELPSGISLELGATSKARAADRCAALVADTLGTGVLLSLGGDIATAGPGPQGGWTVRVCDGEGEPATTICLPACYAVATSSTLHRAWTTPGGPAHHILDPVTGLPAAPVWRTATVAARSCVEANTWTTAALVRGAGAPSMLRAGGRTSRLVAADGAVLRLGGWPQDAPAAA